jgi:hypothetical protein
MVRYINVMWTRLSRETMRMSADPKTPFEIFIGYLVNIFRFLFNNFNIILVFILAIYVVVIFSTKKGYSLLPNHFSLFKKR